MGADKLAQKLSASEHASGIRYERILTPDGRLMAYRDFGAPDGRPMLYIHNMMGGAIWPARMEQLAAARGWRIIAPSRPGFGLSDSYAARDMELVRRSCSDMRALLDYLGIERALVFGMMSSAGLAIRFAKDNPDRTQSVMTTGHAGLIDMQMVNAMDNPSRAMAKTYFKSPTALRFMIRVAVASVDVLGPGQMLKSNFRRCPPDAALMQDTALLEALGEGLKHAIMQGGEAFSRDGFVALHDWRADIEALRCPALCMLGDQDSNYPVQQAQRLMADLPNYRLEVLAGGGQFTFYGQFDRALDLMDSLAG